MTSIKVESTVPKNGIWCYRCHKKQPRKNFWVKGQMDRGFYSMYCHPCTKAVDREMAAKAKKDCGCRLNGDTWVFCDAHTMNSKSSDSTKTE